MHGFKNLTKVTFLTDTQVYCIGKIALSLVAAKNHLSKYTKHMKRIFDQSFSAMQ
jgi:hypothetical protein